jgi:riboflavin-specific deaminase-like protein
MARKLPRPFVTSNFAVTWDGRISTRRRTPADFTSPKDKRRLVEIRAECDAVLASARTVTTDNMTMGLPDPALRAARVKGGQSAYPVRVLLTNSGRIDPKLRLFESAFSPIVIFSTTRMPARVRSALAGKADLWLHEAPEVNVVAMMATLRSEYSVKRLVCEGGAQIFRALLSAGLVDEIHITLAPKIFGGQKAPTLTGVAGAFLAKSIKTHLSSMEVIDGECLLRYRIRPLAGKR